MEEKLIYFAYGSNLMFARLHARTPSIKNLGIGKLVAHRLSFTKPGGDGSGKCGIESVAGEDFVLGVLYEMDAEEKPVLDEIEGVGHGYRFQSVEVELNKEKVMVFTYYPTRLDCEYLPYDWYKRFVLEGARENQFPESYIRQIESVESKVDPDKSRQAMNLQIGRQT